MAKLSIKTITKLNWVEKNYHKFENRLELRKGIERKFKLNPRQPYRILEIFDRKKLNTNTIYTKTNMGTEKVIINDSSCYFCKSKKSIVGHHLCYSPELIVFLCPSCHKKIHILMKKQHQIQISQMNRFKIIKNKMGDLKKLL